MTHRFHFAAAHAVVANDLPQADAVVFPDQTLTHNQIMRLGLAFATRMRMAGVGASSRVQLRTPEPVLVLAVMLGTSWIGAEFLPFAGDGATPPALEPTHVLFDPRVRSAPVSGSIAIAIDESWSPAATPDFDQTALPDIEAPWLWVHTSGTTGLPKFLSLSQRMVTQRSQAVGDDFRAGSRHVLLAHCYSRPFLARAGAALLNGSVLFFGLKPQEWHSAEIDLVSGSRALVGPTLAGQTLKPRVRRIELAGSRLPDHEAITLLDSFDVVDDTYGASETSKTYSTLWQKDLRGLPTTVGRMRDSIIEIVDSSGKQVFPGEWGFVRVRNHYMADAYLNDAKTTTESFRDNWFYPGDVGQIEKDGRLRFSDRMDHVMNISGNKINAFAVDQLMISVNGIKDAVCFRNPKPGAEDELFAFVVFEDAANRLQSVASARHAVSEKFGDYAVPRVIQPVAAIPRKPDGAPDRTECGAMVLKVVANRSKKATIVHGNS